MTSFISFPVSWTEGIFPFYIKRGYSKGVGPCSGFCLSVFDTNIGPALREDGRS